MISATEELMVQDLISSSSSPPTPVFVLKAGLIGSRPWQTMELQKAGAQPQLFYAAEAGTTNTMSLHRPAA